MLRKIEGGNLQAKMWNAINHDEVYSFQTMIFHGLQTMQKKGFSPNHDKMWLQNHEKVSNIETMKK
jgi:hypothetical protein